MTRPTRHVVAALAVATSLALAACGGPDPGDDAGSAGELTVLAAASLTDVFDEMATGFEAEHDAQVTFAFGSSTDLAEQAADGAPGDVLATADEESMRLATEAGAVGDATAFATNVLVLVTPPQNPAGVTSLADLTDVSWVRCADEVPCGRVALAVLEDQGIDAAPVSLEEDVRATLDKVVSGEVDAGLVYATDAVAAGDAVTRIDIDGAQDRPTTYVTGALEQSGDAALARAWIDYLTSEEGTAVLADAGFDRP